MKTLWLFLICNLLLSGNPSAQIFKKVKKRVENKTARELGKKAEKEVEEVFNPEEEPADKEPKPEPIPPQTEDAPPPSGEGTDPLPAPVHRTSDFVRGSTLVFEDSLRGELTGEFPSKWDLLSGTVEVMEFDGGKVIGFVKSGSRITPLMKTETYLPERFTLEMECYFHNQGNEGYYIEFDNRKISLRVNIDGIHYRGSRTNAPNGSRTPGWRRVALSFNQRALKVYLDDERLVNVPNVEIQPTNVAFRALSHSGGAGKYAMIRNLHLAEGAVPLYERLMTDGKIVTNDIHFDYDAATLKPSSMPIIGEIARLMEEHPELRFRVEGHTDSDGKAEYNLELSRKRAAAVVSALLQRGIAAERLQPYGYGEEKPIAPNDSAENKARNRRVEFIRF